MEQLFQDLRYGLRILRKSPGVTAAAVITLALGIGATTAIFSRVHGVLLRPLPYKKPDQIVRLWEVNAGGRRVNLTDPNFEDIRSQNHSLQSFAEYSAWPRHDPLTFAFAGVLMLIASAIAILLPARRAASIEPMTALRTE
jgi:ABC-type antimicrobial peptide transport system permease subunit